MALSLPVPAVGTTIGSELALLDIQTEHHKRLHDIGVYSLAVGRLVAHDARPSDALVRAAVYEHRNPALHHMAAGGIALLANNGTSLQARPLGRVYVYNRVNSIIVAQPGFSHEQALSVHTMAEDLRTRARCIGLILSPSLVELFRTPISGHQRELGPPLPFS